ncbi:type II toxin-antitoxin system RelE/ParE family toxin [Candidatus Shapirobacteria bacterium CG_4_8_14_3_um_filter_35_11]|uniref:Type II toxin-antitoxin system RelE/ParE family toxin n=1 Tax=Candidatus Shapirobacteria bacterium CG_4_8_14_3_um_filter_35_11 TaxID=1974874 RepID=A0A2M8GJF7_9BACT|nr:MAG: type II toxin-antitoxin system RelE/ParE family toxin [Candidatus Shapirobacteria bacterium CG_4_8_14_3_um_filter_35_11]
MLQKNLESSYTIKFSDEGIKKLRKLDKKQAVKIGDKIQYLSNFRSLNTIKKMEGRLRSNYRMRVGDIRVIFDVDEENKTVWVVDMGFRGGIYK